MLQPEHSHWERSPVWEHSVSCGEEDNGGFQSSSVTVSTNQVSPSQLYAPRIFDLYSAGFEQLHGSTLRSFIILRIHCACVSIYQHLLLQAGVKNCLKNSNAMVSSILFSWPTIPLAWSLECIVFLHVVITLLLAAPSFLSALGETLWDREWDPNQQLLLTVNTVQPHSLLHEHHS